VELQSSGFTRNFIEMIKLLGVLLKLRFKTVWHELGINQIALNSKHTMYNSIHPLTLSTQNVLFIFLQAFIHFVKFHYISDISKY